MKTFLILIFSCAVLQAQYYEEPNISAFEFSASNVEDSHRISGDLTSYVMALKTGEINFSQAERIIALARHLNPQNRDAMIANASLKHNMQIRKSGPYSAVWLSGALKAYIDKLDKLNTKESVSAAVYLDDILKSVSGKAHTTLWLKASKHKVKADWSKIISNWDAKKLSTPTITADKKNPPSGPISKVTHPDFKSKAKPVFQRQAAINGLMVSSNAQGVNVGITSQVIGTVTPANGKTTFSFKRNVGSSMNQSLIDAEKALKVRYPMLQEGNKIDISFSNKFSDKDGDSAGTAITVMLFSLFEGIQIDKGVAITGTISPEWKVGIVGGVASKIRGALKAKCKIVGIPADNNDAARDMVILYGLENLWKIQVVSLTTLEQAIDLGRTDKKANTKKAFDLFAKTVKYMPRDLRFSSQVNKQRTVNNLKQVLHLYPNHLSARILHDVLSGKTYLRLSFMTSVEEVNRLAGEVLTNPELPDAKMNEILRTLAKYSKRVDRKVAPFSNQIDTFLKGYMTLRRDVEVFKKKKTKELYDKIIDKQKEVTSDRLRLVKLAEQIDKDMKAYMQEMRKKLR